jgi:hypothetical protein
MRNAKERWVVSALCCAALLLGGCGDDDDGGGSKGKPDGGDNESGSGGGSQDASTGPEPLPADTAGKACTMDAECGVGTCAAQVPGFGLGAMPVTAPGGYCTKNCMTDAECGAGGACVPTLSTAAPGQGQCFATCENMPDCREGYQCAGGLMIPGLPVPNTCRPAPDTDQLGNNVAGDMCTAMEDCPGGMCLTMRMGLGGAVELPGGYCSGRCIEDANCGEGGVCLPALLGGAGSCYQACANDSECTREGYRCRLLRGETRGCNPAPDPLPDNITGDACTGDADCGGVVGACQTELPATGLAGLLGQTVPAAGGYCSQECAEDSDCGAGGLCTSGGLGGGVCFKPCAVVTDCRDGYLCETRGLGGGGNDGAAGAPATDAGTSSPETVCTPEPPAEEEDAGAG